MTLPETLIRHLICEDMRNVAETLTRLCSGRGPLLSPKRIIRLKRPLGIPCSGGVSANLCALSILLWRSRRGGGKIS
jgi:hypothetical protein